MNLEDNSQNCAQTGDTTIGFGTSCTNPADAGLYFGDESFKYGVHLGQGKEAITYFRLKKELSQNSLTRGFLLPDNTLEILFAGSQKINWGASLYHSANSDETDLTRTESTLGIHLGVFQDSWETFTDIELINTAKGSKTHEEDQVRGKGGFSLGGRLSISRYGRLLLNFSQNKAQITTVSTTTITNKIAELTQTSLEWGRIYNFEESTFFFKLGWKQTKESVNTTGNPATIETQTLPITLGAENQTTSWMALRASIHQSLPFLNSQKTTTSEGAQLENSLSDTTKIGTGVTIKFESVLLEGSLNAATSNQFNTDNLLSNLSATFPF